MALTKNQRKGLFKALLLTYNLESFKELILLGVGKDIEEIVSGNLRSTVLDVMMAAERGGWLGDLIRAVADDENIELDGPEKQGLKRLLSELQAATNLQSTFAPHVDPFEASFLRMGGQIPFIDRAELRRYAASMLEPNGVKVLLVDGPARSGKTYTREFIEHLSSRLETYEFHYIDLEEAHFPGFHPGDLMVDIALRMGIDRDGIPSKDAQSARWIRNLATWLAGESAKRFDDDERMWWIVIDSIRKVDLSTDMHDLIKRMVSQAEFGAKSMRIILLDYGGVGQLPPNLQDRVGAEEIVDPQRTELSNFLQSSSEQAGTKFEDDALATVVDWVLEQASTPSDTAEKRSFVERLAAAVEDAHQLFFVVEDAAAGAPAVGEEAVGEAVLP